jgi:SAM-dependent MidA family methyltransferase
MNNRQIERIIGDRIKREGPITFESFMEMSLYHPGLGYYMSGINRIGPEGDFYTSPHLHKIFGWLVAIQLDEMKRRLGNPHDFVVVEIGGGKGYLAEGIVDYVIRNLRWKDTWRYVIVERNPHTLKEQRILLAPYGDLIQWRNDLKDMQRFHGCIISNELFDSFPVHIVEMFDRFHELYVTVHENTLKETTGNISTPELSDYIRRYRIPELHGYRTEVNLRIRDFLEDINDLLAEGFLVTIDYGYPSWEYYSEERAKGTLLCYYRHTINENPYSNIGNQDITAHVNFSSLRDWADEIGMRLLGYCPQGTFIVSLGIDELISEKLKTDRSFRNNIPKMKGLLIGMGESHKVMIQYKGKRDVETLKGFKLRNRMNIL